MGASNASAIVTLVERTTRLTLLGHLLDAKHDSATVRDAVIGAMSHLPPHLRRTLTWDQGKEMARHPEIASTLADTRVYFCDPHSPWQRPSNENTNGVLRDYFPKGTDLAVHTAQDLAFVQVALNDRPRKVLPVGQPRVPDGYAAINTLRVATLSGTRPVILTRLASRTTSVRAVAVARSSARERQRATSLTCLAVSALRASMPTSTTRNSTVSALMVAVRSVVMCSRAVARIRSAGRTPS
jgi:hypothetical protein